MSQSKEQIAYGATDNDPPVPPYSEQDLEGGTAPPSYGETQNEAPPPTYDSLYGEIQEARRNATSRGGFLKNVCSILLNTIGFTVFVAFLLAIPITMIVIGALNLESCPMESLIPKWLIIGGSVASFMQILTILKRLRVKCKNLSEEQQQQDSCVRSYNTCNSLIGCFNLAWFFAGNYWVYRHYPLVHGDICDPVTYYFSFWIITAVYIFIGLICCCSCCIAMCAGSK